MLRERVEGQHLAILALLILSAGLLTRLGPILIRSTPDSAIAEPVTIALSLVRNGTYANAYGHESGSTAHCPPLFPLILAATFRVFGTGPAGRLAFSVLGSVMAALAYSLLPLLGRVCRLGVYPGFLAGMTGALVPMNYWSQTGGIFDAPYTMVAFVTLCCLVGRSWMSESFPVRSAVIVGGLGGVTSLLNPTVLPILFTWMIVGAWRFRHKAREVLLYFAVAGVFIATILAPWAIHNYNALGRLIWTRSNFGLELQLSNNDHTTADDEKNVRAGAPTWVHPFADATEWKKVKQMGEPAYNDAKRKEATDWIMSHPSSFARLTLQRILYFWFPPMRTKIQSCLEGLLTILGLGGLVYLLKIRHAAGWLFAGVLASYPAVYALIEISPRYRCPIEPFLFLLGAYWLAGSRAIPATALSSSNTRTG